MDIILLEPGSPALLSDDDAKQASALIDELWHVADPKPGKCIQLVSLSSGIFEKIASQTSSDAATKMPLANDLIFVKYVDQTSATLLNYCLCGKPISVGEDHPTKIHMLSTDGDNTKATVTLALNDAMVSNVQILGRQNDKPIEQISLNFTKISWTYRLQKPTPV